MKIHHFGTIIVFLIFEDDRLKRCTNIQETNIINDDFFLAYVAEKLMPGDVVQVEGELRTRKWQDKDGADRFTTEIIVNDFPKKLPRYYTKDGQSASQVQPSQPVQAVGQDFNQPIDSGMDLVGGSSKIRNSQS